MEESARGASSFGPGQQSECATRGHQGLGGLQLPLWAAPGLSPGPSGAAWNTWTRTASPGPQTQPARRKAGRPDGGLAPRREQALELALPSFRSMSGRSAPGADEPVTDLNENEKLGSGFSIKTSYKAPIPGPRNTAHNSGTTAALRQMFVGGELKRNHINENKMQP